MALSLTKSTKSDASALPSFTDSDNFCAIVEAPEIVRRRILLLLDEGGRTQKRLSEVVGAKSQSWASQFLDGTRPFDFEKLRAVAKWLHVTPADLIADLSSDELTRSDELIAKRTRSKIRRKGAVKDATSPVRREFQRTTAADRKRLRLAAEKQDHRFKARR